ncbi:tetratricopeptide repeat protein [Flavobacterium sp.]|uniref:tetratricopeptide repeat protein n=1 Tax=Flavobacterium sp. TaxID=239 RepID=UPI0040486394
MKSILRLITFILLFQTQFSFGCLNGETLELKNGVLLYQDSEYMNIPKGHDFYKNDFEAIIKDLRKLYKETNDIDYLSDIGVVLILQKKYNEAIKLYNQIEKTHPNRYSTASNLGTIYELTGDNVSALKWIEKALKINPISHNSSEWIHVNILKAKVNNLIFSSQNIINTNFTFESLPKTNLKNENLESLRFQIYFQLNERMSFIKEKDKSIAVLLFDLANIDYLLGKKSNQYKELYKMAIGYGFDKKFVEDRLKAIEKHELSNKINSLERENKKVISKKLRDKKNNTNYILFLSFSITLSLILYFLFKKFKK